MEVTFLNAKENSELTAIQVQPGTAIIGLNITNAGTLTKDGFPQFRFYPSLKTVTFGVQRLHKPEERASMVSVAGQVYAFVAHNPGWIPNVLLRPIYDITPDDSLSAALLEPEIRPDILIAGTQLSAILGELTEWTADRYTFVKRPVPRLLNNFLNVFPFPFKDIPGKHRAESCWKYLAEQTDWWDNEIGSIQPIARVYPNVKYDCIFYNKLSALYLVDSERFGSDDLIAQRYFESSPEAARLVIVRKIHGSTKHHVTVINSSLYDSNMTPYPYPNVKELNTQERRGDGDASWKNLKVQTIGPKKGTALSMETIWNATKIGE